VPTLTEQQTALEHKEDAVESRLGVVAAQTVGSVAVLALIGALSVWANEPWLTASLGPSVMTQALLANTKSATMYDTFLGQLVGLGVGFAGLYAVGAQGVPALASGEHLTWIRIAAVVIAFVLLVPFQHLLKIKHPPAGATALLVALGFEPPSWHTVWVMIVGIVMITVFGEAARALVMWAKQGPAAAKTMAEKP